MAGHRVLDSAIEVQVLAPQLESYIKKSYTLEKIGTTIRDELDKIQPRSNTSPDHALVKRSREALSAFKLIPMLMMIILSDLACSNSGTVDTRESRYIRCPEFRFNRI